MVAWPRSDDAATSVYIIAAFFTACGNCLAMYLHGPALNLSGWVPGTPWKKSSEIERSLVAE